MFDYNIVAKSTDPFDGLIYDLLLASVGFIITYVVIGSVVWWSIRKLRPKTSIWIKAILTFSIPILGFVLVGYASENWF